MPNYVLGSADAESESGSPARRRDQREAWTAPLGHRANDLWLTGYRRLTIRYERKANHFLAFLILAAALTCCKKLRKAAT
jgi:hypothetical protein